MFLFHIVSNWYLTNVLYTYAHVCTYKFCCVYLIKISLLLSHTHLTAILVDYQLRRCSFIICSNVSMRRCRIFALWRDLFCTLFCIGLQILYYNQSGLSPKFYMARSQWSSGSTRACGQEVSGSKPCCGQVSVFFTKVTTICSFGHGQHIYCRT